MFYIGRIKAGRLQEMKKQTLWIYQYARHYWLVMIFYTVLGMVSTVVALLTSLVSKDLVDIITGHETGQVIRTFCMMIGLNVGKSPAPQEGLRIIEAANIGEAIRAALGK